MHVVQVGTDDSVFRSNAPSDTLERQRLYADILNTFRADSKVSNLILTHDKVDPMHAPRVAFVPVSGDMFSAFYSTFCALWALHRQQKISLITFQEPSVYGLAAWLFARCNSIPLLGQMHFDPFVEETGGHEGLSRKSVRSRIRSALLMRLLFSCDALRVVGTRILKGLQASGYKKPLYVAPVPVSMDPSVRTALVFAQGKVVLFVGRLVATKNLECWLRVARIVAGRVEKVRFVWVGDGPLRRHLEEYANELGVTERLTMLGAVPYNQMKQYYSDAKVFLLTSHFEGFGRVLVEAGYHGVPSVAPEICGAEDIINSGKTGFLCPVGDEEALADAVICLLENDAIQKEMGFAAYKYTTSTYSTYEMAKRWVEIWIKTEAHACIDARTVL